MQASETTILRRIALATTVVTGFAGLVYEVTWHKYLSNIVGSEARATAIILAVFLGGLSIGYELFGRLSKGKSPHLNLKLLAYAEMAIGIWALFFDQIFSFLGSLTQNLPLTGAQGLGGEILAASFLMLIPTILMGGTLPLLTQGLNLGLKDAPKFHSKIYACNTAGAFLGCLSAGFYFIPSHGLPLTMFYMAILNLVSGFALGLVATAASRESIATELATSENQPGHQIEDAMEANPSRLSGDYLSRSKAFMVATLAGFYSIALQTILVRVTGLSLGSSEYAFSMIVSLFIFMLALGASGVSKLEKVGLEPLKKNQGLMILGACFVYVSMNYWNYINHLVRITFGNSEIGFYGYFAASFLWMGLLLSLVLGTMGRTLPLLFSACRQDRKDLGGFIGTLYGVNTVGCVLGALLGGYIGLYYLNLDQIFRVLIALMLASYILVSVKKSNYFIRISWALGLLFIVFVPDWNKQYKGVGLFRLGYEVKESYDGLKKLNEKIFGSNQKLIAYKDGPSGTISILELKEKARTADVEAIGLDQTKSVTSQQQTQDKLSPSYHDLKPSDGNTENSLKEESNNLGTSRSILVNGKSDGSTAGADLVTTKLLGHLPGLLSLGTTGDAAVIGFGTGITVGNLALYPNINKIDTIEISNVVKDFSKYFAAFNLGAGESLKVNWITADAYRVLTSTKKTYDIIISEPSNPWVTGVERLYTQEFYKIVKSSLSPGGIYAQWFHSYSISDSTLALVMNTYASVFPYIYTFRSFGADLIILGSNEELTEANMKALDQRLYIPAIKNELKAIEITSSANLLRFEVLNSVKAFADQGLHTLDFPKLSYRAGKDFYLNLNSDIEQISESLVNLPFGLVASKATLFSKFRDFHSSDDIAKRKQILSESCPSSKLGKLDSKWLSSARMCRGALLHAVREGWLAYDQLQSDEVSMALIKSYDKKSWTLNEAKNFLAGYVRVHSDYFPISKDEFMAKTEICRTTSSQEATYCIFNSLNLMQISGYFEEANTFAQTFEASLKGTIKSQDWESLKVVESRSKLARASSNGK